MTFDKLQQRWAERARQAAQRAEALEERVRSQGAKLFRQFGVRKVVLFGSIAARRWHAHSDVDLLALGLTAERYWELRYELEEALGVPVDLYTETDDPLFAAKMIERGKVIYEAES